MSVDYDKFTPKERDNFVKHVLTEEEIRAITFLKVKSSHGEADPKEVLEVCFQAARRKMEDKLTAIRQAREADKEPV